MAATSTAMAAAGACRVSVAAAAAQEEGRCKVLCQHPPAITDLWLLLQPANRTLDGCSAAALTAAAASAAADDFDGDAVFASPWLQTWT